MCSFFSGLTLFQIFLLIFLNINSMLLRMENIFTFFSSPFTRSMIHETNRMWKNKKVSTVVILLIFVSFLPYLDADMTNEEKGILYRQLEKGLITDANLYALQNLFYPSDKVQKAPVLIILCNEDFIVQNISNNNSTDDPAFKKNKTCGYYEANYQCYYNEYKVTVPCKNAYDNAYDGMIFTVSAADSSSVSAKDLTSYMDELVDTLAVLDSTWFFMIRSITQQLLYPYYNSLEMLSSTISLFVNDLQTMPSTEEVVEVLSSLLSWV